MLIIPCLTLTLMQDTTPPYLTTYQPGLNTVDVAKNSIMKLTFQESITSLSTSVTISLVPDDGSATLAIASSDVTKDSSTSLKVSLPWTSMGEFVTYAVTTSGPDLVLDEAPTLALTLFPGPCSLDPAPYPGHGPDPDPDPNPSPVTMIPTPGPGPGPDPGPDPNTASLDPPSTRNRTASQASAAQQESPGRLTTALSGNHLSMPTPSAPSTTLRQALFPVHLLPTAVLRMRQPQWLAIR